MKFYQAIVQNSTLIEKSSSGAASIYSHLHDAANERQKRILDLLPSGSGFDCGTTLESANDNKIVFKTQFHHMTDAGYYNGWTYHKVTINPSLMHGFLITCSGINKNGIKEYIYDVFSNLMLSDFEWLKA